MMRHSIHLQSQMVAMSQDWMMLQTQPSLREVLGKHAVLVCKCAQAVGNVALPQDVAAMEPQKVGIVD